MEVKLDHFSRSSPTVTTFELSFILYLSLVFWTNCDRELIIHGYFYSKVWLRNWFKIPCGSYSFPLIVLFPFLGEAVMYLYYLFYYWCIFVIYAVWILLTNDDTHEKNKLCVCVCVRESVCTVITETIRFNRYH